MERTRKRRFTQTSRRATTNPCMVRGRGGVWRSRGGGTFWTVSGQCSDCGVSYPWTATMGQRKGHIRQRNLRRIDVSKAQNIPALYFLFGFVTTERETNCKFEGTKLLCYIVPQTHNNSASNRRPLNTVQKKLPHFLIDIKMSVFSPYFSRME